MKKIIILCLSVLLFLSCSETKTPMTLEEKTLSMTLEEKTLPILIEQAKGEINYEASDIEATLLTIGSFAQGYGGTSVSVAYVLLKNDSVLIIAPKYVHPPFTKDEARLLIKSKIRGEMLLFD